MKTDDKASISRLTRVLIPLLPLRSLEGARSRVLHLAVDSTRFSPTSASTYYVRALRRLDGKPGHLRSSHETDHHLEQTVAAETRKQLLSL